MTGLVGYGLRVDPPPGWDARLYRRPAPERGVTYPVLHLANFALPPDRGDYGGGAVEAMGPGHVLVTLVEFAPESAATPLFARVGRPWPLGADAFRTTTLQRPLPGQAGTQWFFQEQGRPFCLYAVLGSHAQRQRLVPRVNEALGRITVERGAAG
ncbi:MAG: hypothetical protein ACRD0L_17120 [Acidimicrobiales bacterium]